MKILLENKRDLNSVWRSDLKKVSEHDLTVLGFNGLGLVSYKKELSGESEYFQDLAKLSKQANGVIVCGCDTDTYGVFRHSVAIADKGKLLGVSDMAHTVGESEFTCGSGFRVYDTSAGKIGLVVAEDLYFPETTRTLALCDAEFIVCVFKTVEDFMPQIMLRAMAFANGVAMSLSAKNYSCVVDVRGEVKISGGAQTQECEIKIEKDYRLISSRRRGLYRDFSSGY